MSAFAYHGVCMMMRVMMMTMMIDVWHTEVSVANGSKLENKTLHVAISNSLFDFFPLGGIAICEQPPQGPHSSPLSPAPGVGSKKKSKQCHEERINVSLLSFFPQGEPHPYL